MSQKIYQFAEHELTIQGNKENLIEIARALRQFGCEGTIGDLIYKIEYAFDIDGIRSEDEGEFDNEYDDNYVYHI